MPLCETGGTGNCAAFYEGEFCYETYINEGIANGTTPSESYTEVKALYKYRKGMTWEDYLNSDYNKITDSTTITYDNKKIEMKKYIKKLYEEETKWLESCKNASEETYCPSYTSINYENTKLFAEPDDYDDYIDNGVLNLPGFNNLPNRFYDQFNNKFLYKVNDLLKSEIKDYSQGCYMMMPEFG